MTKHETKAIAWWDESENKDNVWGRQEDKRQMPMSLPSIWLLSKQCAEQSGITGATGSWQDLVPWFCDGDGWILYNKGLNINSKGLEAFARGN